MARKPPGKVVMPGELHELSRAIGSLEANVRTLAEELKEEREGAAEHRRDLREVISSLSQSVRTLADQVHEIRPIVLQYREQRDEAKGAARYRKWLWGIVGAAGATLLSVALDLMKMLGFRPPPHP